MPAPAAPAVSTIRRPDFTNALVHLTRDRIEMDKDDPFLGPSKTIPAFVVLKEILASRSITGSGGSGYVRGERKAVCLSEIPLSLVHMLTTRRYSTYGIAISKAAAYAQGGRPVIYLPLDEADWIPPEQLWRLVRFEFGEIDFTHEREWRVPDNLDLAQVPGFYVLVSSPTEASEIEGFKSNLPNMLGVLPLDHLRLML